MTTPVNGLTELTAAQPQPHIPINAAMRLFDAVVNLSVIGRTAAPAGGEATGDRYIVTTGTGAFVGHDNSVAVKTDDGWDFHVPKDGWFARVRNEAVFYYFSEDESPDAWVELATGGGPGGGLTDPVLMTESATPTAPAAGSARLFNLDRGVFGLPHWLLDNGMSIPLLFAVGASFRQYRENGNNGTIAVTGCTAASVGTAAVVQPTFASMLTSLFRIRYTTTAAINSSGSARASSEGSGVPRGDTTLGYGGALLHIRFGSSACSEAGTRFFAGFQPGFGIITTTVDPSSLINMAGIGKDAADTNLHFMHNDGSGTATKVDLGITLASLSGMMLDLYILVARQGNVRYGLLADGVVIESGEVTTDLPTTSVRMNPILHINTAAGTTAQNIEHNATTWFDLTGVPA
jgi:hypothetical protein